MGVIFIGKQGFAMKFDNRVDADLQSKITEVVDSHAISTPIGIVENAGPYAIDGQPGYLLWHYIYYNEVSFLSATGRLTNLYTSIGDDYAEAEFQKRIEQFNSSKEA